MVNAPDNGATNSRGPGGRAEDMARPPTCLGRTCMKWTRDGELSDLDVQLVRQRLIAADAEAAGLLR
ncbi:MAG: hypothetical protein ER33_07195 [Cyanobium sp. CACIAM 14]|nr:MAG: hypothetical protein ER33_07195 [Cyanobium sp. CACIAM 14]